MCSDGNVFAIPKITIDEEEDFCVGGTLLDEFLFMDVADTSYKKVICDIRPDKSRPNTCTECWDWKDIATFKANTATAISTSESSLEYFAECACSDGGVFLIPVSMCVN